MHADAADLLPPPRGRDTIDATQSSRPDLVVPVYPCTQLQPVPSQGWNAAHATKLFASEADRARFCSNTFAQELKSAQVSLPPPQLVVHSTGDRLLEASVHTDPYVKALNAIGADCEYILSPWGGHGAGLHAAWGPACLDWLRQSTRPDLPSQWSPKRSTSTRTRSSSTCICA